jgi:hypothetical protein
MEKVRRTRLLVATSERLIVWYRRQRSDDTAESEAISVECPHCGEEALVLDLEERKQETVIAQED